MWLSCQLPAWLISFPLAELAKVLVIPHGFSVTFITFSEFASTAHKAFLDDLPTTMINSIQLPPVPLTDLFPADAAALETLSSLASLRSIPALGSILAQLKKTTNLVAFVADLFASDTFDVARELGVPVYMFFTSNLMLLSLMLHLPELNATTTCNYRDLPAPLELPGCVRIPGAELFHPLQDRSNDCYSWMVHHGRKYREPDGILVNTFADMEPEAAKILTQRQPDLPPIHLVGPLFQTGQPAVENCECLSWLDEQPRGSVLFVSFGSCWKLTCKQTTELACGLEMSGQKFLWVIRSPSDSESNGNYLPQGFLERTKKVGMVVRSWAPQMQVLGHRATGGFLSHCGWNSTLESVMHGVPMICWPLYAEQRMNAVMLSAEGKKVALRPKSREDGVYGREEISRIVKELMMGEEGKKVRGRARELQAAAVKAIDGDGGASCKTLADVADNWKKINTTTL